MNPFRRFLSLVVIAALLLQGCNSTGYSEEEKAYIAEVNHRRISLDDYFRKSETSPLPDSSKVNFKGLFYYEVDPAYKVTGRYKSTSNEIPFDMPYSQGGIFEFVKAGEISFTLQGKEYKLNAYKDIDHSLTPEYRGQLIIPFYDLTNKTETYPGGRFLEFFNPDKPEVTLDFNLAFNPLCVHNPTYNCPIPPPENMLETGIRAGEKISAEH